MSSNTFCLFNKGKLCLCNPLPSHWTYSVYFQFHLILAKLWLIPLSRWSPGRSPGWFTGWSPGWHSFHTGERAPGWISLVGLLCSRSTSMAHAFKARARQSWAEKSENIQSGFGACIFIFARFVLWHKNDRPDFTWEFNRDAFHAATSPGCTREFTRDDSRVTFPKSLAAFYPAFHPAFHPRDLSRCDITRVHPVAPEWNLLSVKGVLGV